MTKTVLVKHAAVFCGLAAALVMNMSDAECGLLSNGICAVTEPDVTCFKSQCRKRQT